MRTVIVHLRTADRIEVSGFLTKLFPAQQGEPWICEHGGDPVLYIGFYTDVDTEYEAEEKEALFAVLGGRPSVSLSVDVSGRHEGTSEVTSFVCEILGAFGGVASDEYTDHFWSLEELDQNANVRGHPFFDFRGWYLEGGSSGK